MGLRITTNVASLTAQRNLGLTQRTIEKSMKQLATGSRFADTSEGAGEFAVSELLRGQISGMKAAKNNADFANSFVAVAEGGLNEQNNILVRMRELAIQAASDTLGDEERGYVNLEFQQLISETDRIAKTTSFGTQKLLMGEGKTYEFQIGAYNGEDNIVRYVADTNTTSSSLEIEGLSIDDKDYARDSLEAIDTATGKIAQARAQFGAIQSRLQSVSNNADVQIENLSAAQSRIADTDVAKAVSEMVRSQVLQQFQSVVLAQANQLPQLALKLISS